MSTFNVSHKESKIKTGETRRKISWLADVKKLQKLKGEKRSESASPSFLL